MAERNPIRFRSFNQEVLFATEPMVTIDRRAVHFLKQQARGNERQRVRLCAHKDMQDPLHEMFIVHNRDAYVRPHKHLRGEAFHVIEGRGDVVLFADDGRITSVVRLGDYGSGLPFYYRLEDACYHTLIIRSDILVFHEIKQGPFDPTETRFPTWAPDGAERAARDSYLERVTLEIDAFFSNRAAGSY